MVVERRDGVVRSLVNVLRGNRTWSEAPVGEVIALPGGYQARVGPDAITVTHPHGRYRRKYESLFEGDEINKGPLVPWSGRLRHTRSGGGR